MTVFDGMFSPSLLGSRGATDLDLDTQKLAVGGLQWKQWKKKLIDPNERAGKINSHPFSKKLTLKIIFYLPGFPYF